MDDLERALLPTNCVRTHMLAGAAAGVMEHCIMYPLDSVKTRMQSLKPNPKAAYRTISEALYKMVRHEGVFRPIRGMSAVVTGAGPAHALYFSCYEKMKRVFSGTQTGAHNSLAQGAAGCLATILHDAVMNPAEVVKQRMQMYNSPYRNSLNCAAEILRTEGYRAFYRSYTTQLTMNVPTQSLHFVMYELMQDWTNNDRTYNPKAHMISGAVAGAFAAGMTTPLDVCKTLLNTQERALTTTKQPHITGFLNAASTIYKCCGPRGYFQGLQARVLYTMPSTAISWSVYEFFKYVINQRNQRHLSSHSSSPVHITHLTLNDKTSDLVVTSVPQV